MTRLTLAGIVTLILGLGAGTSYAFWAGSGSATGAATVGAPQPVTEVAANGTVDAALYPGGSADLIVELNNPNSFAVTIAGIAQDGDVTPVGGIGACTVTGVSVPTDSDLDVTVDSGSNVVVHIPFAASMDTSSDSGCQGARFEIPVTLTVKR